MFNWPLKDLVFHLSSFDFGPLLDCSFSVLLTLFLSFSLCECDWNWNDTHFRCKLSYSCTEFMIYERLSAGNMHFEIHKRKKPLIPFDFVQSKWFVSTTNISESSIAISKSRVGTWKHNEFTCVSVCVSLCVWAICSSQRILNSSTKTSQSHFGIASHWKWNFINGPAISDHSYNNNELIRLPHLNDLISLRCKHVSIPIFIDARRNSIMKIQID